MTALQVAYLADVFVSLPIVLIPLTGREAAARWLFGETLPESHSIRTLLGSLWLALLVCLSAGVALPVMMSPILVFQLFYKSFWLLLFALPRLLRGRGEEVPWKLAAIFILFILVYPWLIPWQSLF